MKRTIQSLLLLGIAAIHSQFAFSQVEPKAPIRAASQYQDRIWTNNDGKKVTARAVAKAENKVTLRIPEGKRVQVAIDQLSKEDAEWLANWKPPIITVSASTKDAGWKTRGGKLIPIEARYFTFLNEENRKAINAMEAEIPLLLPAFKEFLVLASKPMVGVESYEKVICKRKIEGPSELPNLVTFTVVKQMPFLDGAVCKYQRMTPEQLLPFQDFLERFSVRDWDKEEAEVKKRFE